MNVVNLKKQIFFIFLLSIILLEPSFRGIINYNILSIYMILFLVILSIYFLFDKSTNYFRIDILFILGFSIVHFQWPIMMAFSEIEPIRFSKLYSNSIYINYGTWLSLLGLISWLIGFSFNFRKKYNKKSKYQIRYQKLLWFSYFLFVSFILFAGQSFLNGDVYNKHGSSDPISGVAGYIYILFNISIIILTVSIIYNNRNFYKGSLIRWLMILDPKYLLLVIVYIFIFLKAGDRGGPLQIVMAFFIIFGVLVRPINVKEFIVLILSGALVMTVIGIVRASDLGALNNFQIVSGYDLTINLANSARTLYMGLSNVPEYHDFFLGKLWLGNILGAIPFAQGTYLKISGDEAHLINTANYITFMRYGLNAHTGEGTSLIVDIYLNFGKYGVIVAMFTLGLFFKKVQIELESMNSFHWIVIAGILGSVTFYMGRAGIFTPLKAILWSFILVMIFISKNIYLDKKENTEK